MRHIYMTVLGKLFDDEDSDAEMPAAESTGTGDGTEAGAVAPALLNDGAETPTGELD